MSVAVVFVSLNGRDYRARLPALSAGDETPEVRTILVDNGSTDGTADAVEAAFPEVQVLRQVTNTGFAEGDDMGVRAALEAGADWVLILNNDTTIAPDTIARMIEVATASPDIGVVCPLILYAGPAGPHLVRRARLRPAPRLPRQPVGPW